MPRERAKERARDKAIKKTLAYRGVFNYPVSFYQLSTLLISRRKFEYKFFKSGVSKLAKNKQIGKKKQKYFLPGIKPVSWLLRKKNAEKLIKKHTVTSQVLRSIPWIKLMAVTGSVAACNAKKDSDLDIFIITSKNRLWLTRFFVVVLLKILGAYPIEGKDSAKICPNLYVDATNLSWPKEKRSIFTAYDIAMMAPVINRDNMYFKFIKANDWIFKYFSNFKINTPEKFDKSIEPKSKLVDSIEKITMRLQQKYMAKRQTKEITTPHFIHFRKHDHYDEILKDYKEMLQKI